MELPVLFPNISQLEDSISKLSEYIFHSDRRIILIAKNFAQSQFLYDNLTSFNKQITVSTLTSRHNVCPRRQSDPVLTDIFCRHRCKNEGDFAESAKTRSFDIKKLRKIGKRAERCPFYFSKAAANENKAHAVICDALTFKHLQNKTKEDEIVFFDETVLRDAEEKNVMFSNGKLKKALIAIESMAKGPDRTTLCPPISLTKTLINFLISVDFKTPQTARALFSGSLPTAKSAEALFSSLKAETGMSDLRLLSFVSLPSKLAKVAASAETAFPLTTEVLSLTRLFRRVFLKFFRLPNKYQNAPLKPKCGHKSDLIGFRNSKLLFKAEDGAFSESFGETRRAMAVESKGPAHFMKLVADVAAIVPDGLVVAVQSAEQLFEIPLSESFKRLSAEKLAFFEGETRGETALALGGYATACDAGRGGVFFCTVKRDLLGDAYLKPAQQNVVFVYGSMASDSAEKMVPKLWPHTAIITCDTNAEVKGSTNSADSVKAFIAKHANAICRLD